MKKIIALASLFILGAAATAFGATADGSWTAQSSGVIQFPANTTNGPYIQFKPSANVHMGYNSSDGINYTVGAYHESGTKLYGTGNGDAKIYMYDTGNTIGTTAPTTTVPTPAASVSWPAGWSALK